MVKGRPSGDHQDPRKVDTLTLTRRAERPFVLIALLLGRFRVFDEEGYSCEDCSPQYARPERGCGEPPIVAGRSWDPAPILERAREEFWDDLAVTEASTAIFPYADLGSVWERAGVLWPWCPLWFAKRCSSSLAQISKTVISYSRFSEARALQSVFNGEFTAGGADLFLLCRHMSDGLRADRLKRKK